MHQNILGKKRKIWLLAFLFCMGFINAQAYDLTVAKDGTGDFTTVQAAINAVPTGLTSAYTIFIKNGKYREKINIPSNKPFIHMIGESVANVFIYYDDPATILGTQNSASFTIGANDFSAMNITFANTYGDGSQGVALLVNADRAAFKNCRFLGNQDTLYLKGSGTPKHYFKDCYIDGNIDFIFGSSIAVFDSCVVYAKTRISSGSSYITAPNTPTGQPFGFVFRDAKLPANTGGTLYYLSRPWPSPSEAATAQKAVFLSSLLSSHIQPAGWTTWDGNTITANIYYGEYNSQYFNGTSVDVSQRVPWSYQLSKSDSSNYSFANMFGSWDPCGVAGGFCNSNASDIAVSNFRGSKGASASQFNWNISWPMTGINYDVYRSNDNINFSIVNTQTSLNDTAVNFSYSEPNPPAGQIYYYYVVGSKSGLSSHVTDTVSISSAATIMVTGTLGSFLQGLGTPSAPQTYIVSGENLSSAITITAPVGYEISANAGTNWFDSNTPILLSPTSGSVTSTSISVRLNATTIGTYSGNITHSSTDATTMNIPVTGTVQSDPLPTSVLLQNWPFTVSNLDSANLRSPGVIASVPTAKNLYLSNGTTLSTVPAFSPLHGMAYGATANGDGSWGTGSGGPGGNLNRNFYQQFTVTAAANYSVRLDSIILSSSFYNTASNTKMAIVYSKTGFTTNDSTDVTGTGGLGGFSTPVLLTNETTAGTKANYRLAIAGATGINLAPGETLTFRIYNSCGSSSSGRYGKIKDLQIMGLAQTAVPLQLISFDAVLEGQKVNCFWSTVNEVNTSKFIIQRSADGNYFSEIGNVNAKNTASKNAYSFMDINPLQGVSYYRLKMVDIDGKTSFSKIVRVSTNTKGVVSINPNPVIDHLVVTYPTAVAGATLTIATLDGKIISLYTLTQGSVSKNITTGDCAKGVYLLIFQNKNQDKIVSKFIKQ